MQMPFLTCSCLSDGTVIYLLPFLAFDIPNFCSDLQFLFRSPCPISKTLSGLPQQMSLVEDPHWTDNRKTMQPAASSDDDKTHDHKIGALSASCPTLARLCFGSNFLTASKLSYIKPKPVDLPPPNCIRQIPVRHLLLSNLRRRLWFMASMAHELHAQHLCAAQHPSPVYTPES